MGKGNLDIKSTMKIERELIHSKFNGRCAYCGNKIKIKDMQVDHIIPRSTYSFHMETRHKIPSFLTHLTISDVNHIDNLFPTCQVCNLSKLNYSLEDFRTELNELMNILENKNHTYRMAKRYKMVSSKRPKPIKFYFEHEQEDRDN